MPNSSNKADPYNKLFLHDPLAEVLPRVYLFLSEVDFDRSLVLFFVEAVSSEVSLTLLLPVVQSFHCCSPFGDASFISLLRIFPISLFILSTSSCVRLLPFICCCSKEFVSIT